MPLLQMPAATNPGDLVNSPDPKTTLDKGVGTDNRSPLFSIKIQSKYEPQEEMFWLQDHVW